MENSESNVKISSPGDSDKISNGVVDNDSFVVLDGDEYITELNFKEGKF